MPHSEETPELSVATRVNEAWRRRELIYPCDATGQAFWPPSDVAPVTGEPSRWSTSAGTGIIYATTTQYGRDVPPRHLALVQLDEGFRMLSEIIGTNSGPAIGVRVRVTFTDDNDPMPVFEIDEEEAA